MGERYKKRRDRHRRMSVTVSPGVHGLDPLRRGSSSLSMNYLTTLGIIVADSESKNGKSRWTTSLQWHRPSPRERYKMHATAGFLARLSARRLPILLRGGPQWHHFEPIGWRPTAAGLHRTCTCFPLTPMSECPSDHRHCKDTFFLIFTSFFCLLRGPNSYERIGLKLNPIIVTANIGFSRH